MGAVDAWLFVDGLWRDNLSPPRALTVSEWADQYRVLTRKTSAEAGPWRTDRTPYLRDIMDALSSDSLVRQVVFVKGTQLGGTECGNNWLGYIIHIEPGPVMVVQPTGTLAKRWSRQRLASMVRETPELRERVSENRSRDDANTTLLKDFDGGVLVIAGANSAADLRSMPVRFIDFEEVDAYPLDVDGEGDPVELARKRSDTFARSKEYYNSTPTRKGFSRIEQKWDESDQRRFYVPCPQCQAMDWLQWSNVRWHDDDPATAHMVCTSCGGVIEEHHKTAMLAGGEWRATHPGRAGGRIAGFHLSSLYSPLGWKSWRECVSEFLVANKAAKAGDVSKLKAWTNTVLAETWEEQGDSIEQHALQQRAEAYPLGVVPAGGLLLTAAVDVQGNRLEMLVRAWGPGEESWLVDYLVLWGDPGQDAVWGELRERLMTEWPHASGKTLRLVATAIDSGGHHTQQVYRFTASLRHRHVFAIKGLSIAGRPILNKPADVDITHQGRKIKGGAQVWGIGTDTAKSLVYGRLRVTSPGPGFMHLSQHLPAEYFEMLTAERLVTRYVRGRPRLEWAKPAGKRNEALDLEVYAYAAAIYAGVPRMRAPHWQRLAKELEPDLFSAQPDNPPQEEVHPGVDQVQEPAAEIEPASSTPVAQPTPRPAVRRPLPRRGGFVKGWK